MKTVVRLTLLSSLMIGAAAYADDGDDFKFNLVNKSTVEALQFYTIKKDGKWSNDWLSTALPPGKSRVLNFYDKTDTRCEVRTRIVFTDGSEFDTPVDYCGTTSVIVTDKTLIAQ